MNSIFTFFMFSMMPTGDLDLENAPVIHKVIFSNFKGFIAIIFCGSLLAVVAGINYLRLKRWARNVLEILTWLMAAYIVVFLVIFLISTSSFEYPNNAFAVMFTVMPIVISAIYCIPVYFILKYLRKPEVREILT